jgi:hypothetical protein
MEDYMEPKPDRKSFLLRRLFYKRYPWIIKSSDGKIYEEKNGMLHHKILGVFEFLLYTPIFWFVLVEYFNYLGVVIFSFVSIAIIRFIIDFPIRSILYRYYKFEIIDEEEMKKYPWIKL